MDNVRIYGQCPYIRTLSVYTGYLQLYTQLTVGQVLSATWCLVK